MRPRQYAHRIAEGIFKCIPLDEIFSILIRFSLKFILWVYNWQYVTVSSGKGLAPGKWWTFTLPSADRRQWLNATSTNVRYIAKQYLHVSSNTHANCYHHLSQVYIHIKSNKSDATYVLVNASSWAGGNQSYEADAVKLRYSVIQSNAAIMRSDASWYHHRHCDDSGRT